MASSTLTPAAFIAKWRASKLGEDRNGGAARQHFLDLCELLGVPKPADVDPKGEWYSFERGAARTTTGARGWADVWMRDHFGFEYKGPGGDLNKAYAQLKSYADALENPPLLVVSDTKRIIIHTNFTSTVTATHVLELDDLTDPHKLELLRWVFTDPNRLKPSKTIQALTDEAARKFAELAQRLRTNGHKPEVVAHFINRLAFCMFAEDVNLLPKGFFTERLHTLVNHPDRASKALQTLFSAMSKGGMYGDEPIEWFNGGLFDDDKVLPLSREDIALLHEAARMDWQDIDPTIFGTLFERGLDPAKRSQLGAHYTDAEKIMMIVEPVIRQPLLREWEDIRGKIEKEIGRKTTGKRAAAASQAKALSMRDAFIGKLRDFRVLDPACGSGNFLYLALQTLKAIEHRVYVESEVFGLNRPAFMETGPHNMLGIELNSYAAELARMTVWIGEIQWCLQHGWEIYRNPILKSLRTIQNHDALINPDGTEFQWPKADAIIGNPPFLGNKKLIGSLGEEYVVQLRKTYPNSGGYDLVTYWFRKVAAISKNMPVRAGLVATQSIRQGANREVLDTILKTSFITHAWADEPWTVDGAAVRVSLVCSATKGLSIAQSAQLNGEAVDGIFSDLKGATKNGAGDITLSKRLTCNRGVIFQGTIKGGDFDIPYDQAKAWLKLPSNPNGRPNSDVLKPWMNGMDVTRRPSGNWIIDFGTTMTEDEAALYEAPFAYILDKVKPIRSLVRREGHAKNWWRYGEARPGMRAKLDNLPRFIVTPRVSKHRIFTWAAQACIPDSRLYAITRDDDVTFGILHSKFHEIWSLATSSRHGMGNDPTYNSASCFETFPFPKGLEPNRKPAEYANPHVEAIVQAARRLNDLREAWLNPQELVRTEKELVEGYPDRILPVNAEAAAELKNRTLTKLYNTKPTWLKQAHSSLDAAVASAYGWNANLSNDEILAKLLALNLTSQG